MPVPPGLKLTPALLNSLKRAQLRAIASSLGTPISGTKKVLAERVCAALGRSRFPVIRSDGGGVMRVLSVDMGIRNLAVCLLEVPLRPGGEGGEGGGGREGREGWGMGGHSYRERDKYLMVPSVIAWRRMSVPPSPAVATTTTITATTKNNNDMDNSTACSESIPDEPPAPPQMPSPTPPAESFSASTFSHHAYNLAITLLGLSGPASQPHQILIETQRYRSHGGAAVLEWTLRVNMLENMLWGCLRTLAEVGYWGSGGGAGSARESCSEQEVEKGGESIEGVNPSKVAGFWEDWLVRNGVIGVEKLQTTYAESKKSKTRIVKGLLCAPCTQSSYSSSSASFDAGEGIPLFELVTDQARETAGLFLEVNENGNGSGVRKPIVDSGKRNKKQPKGKLDDLADCLLQGLAWVKWEEGRRRMVSGEGGFAGVDIAELVERGERTRLEAQEAVKKVRRRGRKVVEAVVGEALKTKVGEVEGRGVMDVVGVVEVTVKRKRRVRVKDIQENDETPLQDVTPQEIEVVDTPPALVPIVAPAKKPRKPRAKKVPPQEIRHLGSEAGADERTDTPKIVEPALLSTKKTRKRRAKKVPLAELSHITPPGLETGAGEGKVITQETEEIIPQGFEGVPEKKAVLEQVPGMEDIHTAAPVVEQIVEPVSPPPPTRKPRAKKLSPAEIIYITPLGSEVGASEGRLMAQHSEGITAQEIGAAESEPEVENAPPAPVPIVEPAKKASTPRTKRQTLPEFINMSPPETGVGERETLTQESEETTQKNIDVEAGDEPEPEPEVEVEGTPIQIVESVPPPKNKTRKRRTKKLSLPEAIYITPPALETGAASGDREVITHRGSVELTLREVNSGSGKEAQSKLERKVEDIPSAAVDIVEKVRKVRKTHEKKQLSPESNSIYIPSMVSETGAGEGERVMAA